MENRMTNSERISALEGMIREQRIRLDHLEELHRMQALPPFFLLYVVEFEGPQDLVISPNVLGEPRCIMCGDLMRDGDNGLKIETRHVREMNDNIFITRTALMHTECYRIASSRRP